MGILSKKQLVLNIKFPIWFLIVWWYTFYEFICLYITNDYNVSNELIGLTTFINNPITYLTIKKVFNTSFHLIYFSMLNILMILYCFHIYVILQEIIKSIKSYNQKYIMYSIELTIKNLTIIHTIKERNHV